MFPEHDLYQIIADLAAYGKLPTISMFPECDLNVP
jgi:hypothetical protein